MLSLYQRSINIVIKHTCFHKVAYSTTTCEDNWNDIAILKCI